MDLSIAFFNKKNTIAVGFIEFSSYDTDCCGVDSISFVRITLSPEGLVLNLNKKDMVRAFLYSMGLIKTKPKLINYAVVDVDNDDGYIFSYQNPIDHDDYCIPLMNVRDEAPSLNSGIILNYVKENNTQTGEFAELLMELNQHCYVIPTSFRNGNSGNTIVTYFWVPNKDSIIKKVA